MFDEDPTQIHFNLLNIVYLLKVEPRRSIESVEKRWDDHNWRNGAPPCDSQSTRTGIRYAAGGIEPHITVFLRTLLQEP